MRRARGFGHRPRMRVIRPKVVWHVEVFIALKIFFAWRNFTAQFAAKGARSPLKHTAWAKTGPPR